MAERPPWWRPTPRRGRDLGCLIYMEQKYAPDALTSWIPNNGGRACTIRLGLDAILEPSLSASWPWYHPWKSFYFSHKSIGCCPSVPFLHWPMLLGCVERPERGVRSFKSFAMHWLYPTCCICCLVSKTWITFGSVHFLCPYWLWWICQPSFLMVVTMTRLVMNPVVVVALDDKSTRTNRSAWILVGVSGVILAEVSRFVEDCDPLTIPFLSREGMVMMTCTSSGQ